MGSFFLFPLSSDELALSYIKTLERSLASNFSSSFLWFSPGTGTSHADLEGGDLKPEDKGAKDSHDPNRRGNQNGAVARGAADLVAELFGETPAGSCALRALVPTTESLEGLCFAPRPIDETTVCADPLSKPVAGFGVVGIEVHRHGVHGRLLLCLPGRLGVHVLRSSAIGSRKSLDALWLGRSTLQKATAWQQIQAQSITKSSEGVCNNASALTITEQTHVSSMFRLVATFVVERRAARGSCRHTAQTNTRRHVSP